MARPPGTRRPTTTEQAAVMVLADQIQKELAGLVEHIAAIEGSSRRLKMLIQSVAPWAIEEHPA